MAACCGSAQNHWVISLVVTVPLNQSKFFLCQKKKKTVKKNKFILHTCECRYDNNMNKAGKSPPPVQTNRNINNPPPILTFKFCIRLADLSLAVKYKFYWCATSTRSPSSISCQYNFMSFYQHLKLFMKNDSTMLWREMVLGKSGRTPVIPLALIVHNI